MEKNIRIKIESKQYDYDNFDPRSNTTEQLLEEMEIVSEGLYRETDGKVELVYDESEETGLIGCSTTVSFDTSMPEVVSTLRSGSVITALVFEKGRRHICVYEIPEGRFEVCVYTSKLDNSVTDGKGKINIDYIIEIGGIKKMRTVLALTIL